MNRVLLLVTSIIIIHSCRCGVEGDNRVHFQSYHSTEQDTSKFIGLASEVLLDSSRILIYDDHPSALEAHYLNLGEEMLNELVNVRDYLPALSFYGCELLLGSYVKQKPDKGLALLNSAAALMDTEAILCLAQYYWNLGMYEKSMEFLAKGDSLEDAWCTYEYSNALMFGELHSSDTYVIPQEEFVEVSNPKNAVRLLTKSANLGLTEAKYTLAIIYLNGLHPIVEVDKQNARVLLLQCLDDPNFADFIEVKEVLRNSFEE